MVALRGAGGRSRALLAKVDAVLLDSAELIEPRAGLARAAELVHSARVVDLAWLRTTPWRERFAASFDPPDRLAKLRTLNGVTIRHMAGSGVSALLLAGWLISRLRWDPSPRIKIALEPFDQGTPGLAGVTVSGRDGFTLSLDRARGGLLACERSAAGDERAWQVLGASRGEPGILGDGIRQAQLCDPTYASALETVRNLLPRMEAKPPHPDMRPGMGDLRRARPESADTALARQTYWAPFKGDCSLLPRQPGATRQARGGP